MSISFIRLVISPEEGDWAGGHFRFHVKVPEGYNIEPPTVSCQSKLWHPNITPEGEVCLSLLRSVAGYSRLCLSGSVRPCLSVRVCLSVSLSNFKFYEQDPEVESHLKRLGGGSIRGRFFSPFPVSSRQNSIDGMGWSPTRRLKDVIWGLSSLFLDLCNFDDPLNFEAAEHYEKDKEGFRAKVNDWILKYASR